MWLYPLLIREGRRRVSVCVHVRVCERETERWTQRATRSRFRSRKSGAGWSESDVGEQQYDRSGLEKVRRL